MTIRFFLTSTGKSSLFNFLLSKDRLDQQTQVNQAYLFFLSIRSDVPICSNLSYILPRLRSCPLDTLVPVWDPSFFLKHFLYLMYYLTLSEAIIFSCPLPEVLRHIFFLNLFLIFSFSFEFFFDFFLIFFIFFYNFFWFVYIFFFGFFFEFFIIFFNFFLIFFLNFFLIFFLNFLEFFFEFFLNFFRIF